MALRYLRLRRQRCGGSRMALKRFEPVLALTQKWMILR